MKILAIDTCTEVASVTLFSSEVKVTRVITDIPKSSGHILKLCDEVFNEVKQDLRNIDLISYTKGPGAFTGVRMCIGVVQGLSLSCKIPTLGFSSLELLGFRASKLLKKDKIALAIDARMGEVYWAIYEKGIISGMKICKPEEVDNLDSSFIGVGSGWKAYNEKLTLASQVSETDLNIHLESGDLIDMSITALKSGEKGTFELPKPIYLRNNVAKKSLK